MEVNGLKERALAAAQAKKDAEEAKRRDEAEQEDRRRQRIIAAAIACLHEKLGVTSEVSDWAFSDSPNALGTSAADEPSTVVEGVTLSYRRRWCNDGKVPYLWAPDVSRPVNSLADFAELLPEEVYS